MASALALAFLQRAFFPVASVPPATTPGGRGIGVFSAKLARLVPCFGAFRNLIVFSSTNGDAISA